MLAASASGPALPKMKKTGTTIVGVCFKGGVVLGADTRATEGPIVCDKNCKKIHYIADNIVRAAPLVCTRFRLLSRLASRQFCCGAGTAADTENVTRMVSSQLELHRLDTGKQVRVVTALTRLKQHLFRYQGHVSAALVLGGVDCTGSYLYTVYPHGSTDKLPYVTMGSGSLAAMAMFESGYKDDMTEAEAIGLVEKAIESGIFNDLGSGSNVDVLVLTRDGGRDLRNYKKPNERAFERRQYLFPKGSTEYLSEIKETFKKVVQVDDDVAMTDA